MGTTVQDVLEGNGQDVGLLGAGEVGDVSVERDALLGGSGLGDSQGDTEDGVGTKVTLVGGTVELVEELVNLGLVLDIDVLLDESGADGLVDVLDGLQDTCESRSELVSPGLVPIDDRVRRHIPLPPHWDLSPSRSSTASCWPRCGH